MRRRVMTLTRYFLSAFFKSLTGSIYIILTLAFWLLFFNPQQGTPDVNYFILVIGIFGAAAVFLITLSIAGRANEATHYPFIIRLSSRVEYLTAVLLSTLIATMALQLLVAILALIFGGPTLALRQFIEIPPIWIAINVLTAVLALHASDFVTNGWSRIYVFGILAIFLFGQSINNESINLMLNSLSRTASNRGWYELSTSFANATNTISSNANSIDQFFGAFGFLFWPFRALPDAIIAGSFTSTQALAPAILLLYAVILYLLAADLFANKDLAFTE